MSSTRPAGSRANTVREEWEEVPVTAPMISNMTLTNKQAVLDFDLARVEELKGYSLTITYTAADASGSEVNDVKQSTFLMLVLLARMLGDQLNAALEE